MYAKNDANNIIIQNWNRWLKFEGLNLAQFANGHILSDICRRNRSEYGRISRRIFDTFFLFLSKFSETRIDRWAEAQEDDGHNCISNIIKWSSNLSNEITLVNEIIAWISRRSISRIPVPLNFASFNPSRYSNEQANMLIEKGFNPKMRLYRKNDTERNRFLAQWTAQLGRSFSEIETDFWFCISKSECNSNCVFGCLDTTYPYIYGSGHRTAKTEKLGHGGFGSVYSGRIHGTDAVFSEDREKNVTIIVSRFNRIFFQKFRKKSQNVTIKG